MKKTFLFLMLLSLQTGIAQTKPFVENYPLKGMDLVLYPFGISNPAFIGTISDSGELNFSFPKDLNSLPKKVKSNSMSDAAFTLFSKCDNSNDILSKNENILALNGDYISLSSKDNPNLGLLYMVTDKNLVPWLESYGNLDAVLGSYFEIIYMESNFNYQGKCTSSFTNAENETFETIYTFNLHLNAGFNFIEYKIESVDEHEMPSMYEENVFVKITKPTRITVTSTQSTPPNTMWIGKYF